MKKSWILESGKVFECESISKHFAIPVSLHGHTYHSEEKLGRMNFVMNLPGLKPFHSLMYRYFKRKTNEHLDYSDFYYRPPISPEEVWNLELEHFRHYGFDDQILAITDHDKIDGCQELLYVRPDLKNRAPISEELSIRYENQVIHLGLIDFPNENAREFHNNLKFLARSDDLDELFTILKEADVLVILNHPLWKFKSHNGLLKKISNFISQYSWGIDALEINGMRGIQENSEVIELAENYSKPLVGGGDRHAPIPSSIFTAVNAGSSMTDFKAEIREGRGAVVFTEEYFQPYWWRIFVRTIIFLHSYRSILYYKRQPISRYQIPERMITDYIANFSGFLRNLVSKFA